MMAVIGVLLACVGLVVLGLVLGAFAACMQSSTISRIEEAMGRGDYDQEQERGRRQA